MYRRHVRLRVSGNDVLEFLLRNSQFPRALMFCLCAVETLLTDMPGDDNQALRIITRLQRNVQEAPLTGLRGKALSALMDKLQIELAEAHEAIRQTWFPSE
jgi:uncharacterized alpha-E superfamily protein